MEDILKFRKILGMSQTEFSNYIGVPIGTLRNWEQGIRKPPEYVFTMILKILERDSMVNIETIKFQNMLNILAEKTSYGYKEWNDVESIDLDDYDAESFSGIMYDRNNNNKVIMDTCLYGHHDIISYFDEYCGTNDFTVEVIEDDEDLYILIKFSRIDEQICIEEGRWYFV